jgi:polar amino acid transport system substrate-binding protein
VLKTLPWMLLAVCLAAGCGLPRDPEGTTDRVRNGVLRVGVMHDPPHVEIGGDPPEFSGVEVEFVQQFAAELDAKVEWQIAGESELMKALQNYELDLVVGGLTESSAWHKHVGFTRPYRKEPASSRSRSDSLWKKEIRHVVAVPPGENAWLLTLERFLRRKYP